MQAPNPLALVCLLLAILPTRGQTLNVSGTVNAGTLTQQAAAGGGGGGGAPDYAFGTNINNISASSLTLPMSVSGANKLLLVGAVIGNGHTATVTYGGTPAGGQSLSLLARTNWYSGTDYTEVFGCYAPGDGNSNVLVSFTGTSDCSVTVVLLTNAAQSSAYGAAIMNYNSGDAGSVSNNVTAVSTDLVVSFLSSLYNNDAAPPLTERQSGTSDSAACSSAGTAAGSANVNCLWYRALTDRFSLISFAVHGP